MGMLSCCFAAKDREPRAEPTSSPSRQSQAAAVNTCASPVLSGDKSVKDVVYEVDAPRNTERELSSCATAPSIFDAAQLHALQVALGSIDGDGFEARASVFTETIQEHLGPSSIVRLLGLASEENNDGVHYLVQLAASTSPTLVAPLGHEHGLPGSSFPVSLGTEIDSAEGAMALRAERSKGGLHRATGCSPRLLLERALLSREPATYFADRSAAAAAGPLERPDAAGPADCLTDVLLIRGATPLTFAALPLICRRRLVGVLWIVMEHPANQYDSQHNNCLDDSATATTAKSCRGLALLNSPAALAQLALSASMALAAASPDPEYVRWLAGAVRRLASSTNLHTLVAGVCTTVAKHVRSRFLADVAVQSALVPEPDSHVGFMLCPETKASTLPSGSPPPVAVTLREAAPMAPLQCGDVDGNGPAQRPKSGVVCSLSRKPLRRTASQAIISRPQGRVTSGSDGDGGGGDRGGGGAETNAATGSVGPFMHRGDSLPPMHTGRLLADPSTAGTSTPLRDKDRDRDPLLGGGASNVRSLRTGSASSAPAVLFSLSAKAFQMSHTLLCRLISKARAQRPPPLVPPGVIVPDMARHVADVRQPSRDVCMLMGSKGAMQGANPPNPATGPLNMDPSGSRGGAASMVLLAMEVAEGGCMLGLYLVFPALTPQPLLVAVRDSCGNLLSKMLLQLVRYKLQSPELGPDFETLRAGVPGSYVSVLRLRDAVDKLQMSPIPGPGRSLKMPPPPAQTQVQNQAQYQTQPSLQPQMQLQMQPPPQQQQQDTSSGFPDVVPLITGGHGQQQQPQQQSPEIDIRRQSIMDAYMVDPSTAASNAASGSAVPTAMASGQGNAVHDTPRDLDPVADGSRGKPGHFGSSAARRFLTHAFGGSPSGRSPLHGPCACGSTGPSTLAATAAAANAANANTSTTAHSNLATNSLHRIYQGNSRMISASGIPSGVGVGSQGVVSAVMLDSTIDAGVDAPAPARFAPAAMMTVHDLDETWGMRGMMGALVESIMTTLRASASELAEALNGTDVTSRAAEGLEDLHLSDVLGHGASGVVLRGMLGTVPVAVKLMEMPDADQDPLSSEVGLSGGIHPHLTQSQGLPPQSQNPQTPQRPASVPHAPLRGQQAQGGQQQQQQHQVQAYQDQQQQQPMSREAFVRSLASMLNSVPNSGHRRTAPLGLCGDTEAEEALEAEGLVAVTRVHPTESEQMRARRTMLRNATELAVMRTISHVNIVQAFAVYDNVIMERTNDRTDGFILRRLDPRNPQTGGSPICTAIVQELCDRGSLADVLADRSFPIILTPRGAVPQHQRRCNSGRGCARGGSQPDVDMRAVYLTLLEIALGLRHLHARRLVHRDLKPANILLKTSPGDPRGWTCKLADFGFALVLDQQDSAAEAKEHDGSGPALSAFQSLGSASVGPGSVQGGLKLVGNGSTGGAPRGWYTVQAQASGTVTHMAPEAVRKNSRIDAAVDIYALGIICWELVCGEGQRPFRSLDPEGIPAAVMAGVRPVFTSDVPPAYKKLAMACWSHDPHRRPRAADVVAYIKQQLVQLNDR